MSELVISSKKESHGFMFFYLLTLLAETAKECLQHQIAGIMVSNHGGRQLDGVLSTVSFNIIRFMIERT